MLVAATPFIRGLTDFSGSCWWRRLHSSEVSLTWCVIAQRPSPKNLSLGGRLLTIRGRGALAEAILEAARQLLDVGHAASARCATALGLLRPVVRPHLGGGVGTAGAALVLEVVGPLAAARAETVRLLVSLAHGRRAIATAQESRHDVKSRTILQGRHIDQLLLVAERDAGEEQGMPR